MMLSLGFVLLAEAISESPAILLDSCANRCDEEEHYNFRKFSCGCYEGCAAWNDCCHDAKDVCETNTQGKTQEALHKSTHAEDVVYGVGSDSCADRCEEEEHYNFRKFQCGCYGGCEDWNDCCHDKKDVCGHEDAPVLLDVAQGLRGDDDDKPRPPIAAASALELSVLLFVALV